MAASYTIKSTTSDSVTISITVDSSYSIYRVFCRYEPKPEDGGTVFDKSYSLSSNSKITIDGLSPETDYAINVGYTNDLSAGVTWIGTGYFTTDAEIDLPEEWSWEASNGPENYADAKQTKKAYNAITNQGTTNEFAHEVWNDMCAKVMEVKDAARADWHTRDDKGRSLLGYNDTLMTSSDTVMTANRFNSLRFNVGEHYSTGIDFVYKGDIIKGEYFETIMDCVNSWIRKL